MEWIAFGIGIAALILSLISIGISKYTSSQNDSRAKVIEAIQDIGDVIKAIEEYQSKGISLQSYQFDALTSASLKKREARRLRSRGDYGAALRTADEGLTILEQDFPPQQFPAALVTRQEVRSWRS